MRTFVLIALAGCSFHKGSAAFDDGPLAGDASTDSLSDSASDSTTSDSAADAYVCTQHSLPPSVNVDATQWAAKFLTSPIWNCNAAGTTTIDSQAGTITSTTCTLGTVDFTNNVAQLTTGSSVMVVRLRGLTVSNNHVLHLQGDKPIVLMVTGNVLVDSGGVIDASASAGTAGPGGAIAGECTTGSGSFGSSALWGGGGGAYGTDGGQGCYQIINGGVANGSLTMTPLRGGCSGASSSNAVSQVGGAGGGAVEISATGTITIGSAGTGNIVASGGGAPAYAPAGGGGGGAGGGILLVAPAAAVFGSSGAARANGGAGSSGCSTCTSNLEGQDGHKTDTAQATDTSGMAGGGNGNDHGRAGGMAYKIGAAALVTLPGSLTTMQSGGRGGGGGGGGRIVVTTGTATSSCD